MPTTVEGAKPWAIDDAIGTLDARLFAASMLMPISVAYLSTPSNKARSGVLPVGTDAGGVPLGGKVRAKSSPNMQTEIVAATYVMAVTGQGVWVCPFDALVTLDHPAADPVFNRYDLVGVRIYDVDAGIGASRKAQLEILPGTPSGSPAEPSFSTDFMPLARVTVNASPDTTIVTGDIVDRRVFTNTRGGVIPHQPFSAETTGAYPGVQKYVHGDAYPWKGWDGLQWLDVGSDSAAIAAINALDTVNGVQSTLGTSGSTVYTATLASGTTASVAFTAPPSGKVIVHNMCASFTSTTAFIHMAFEVRTGASIGSGSVFLAADDSFSARHQTNVQTFSVQRSKLVTGLTPGSSYHVRQMFKVSTGSGSWYDKEIIVEPQL